MNRDSQASIFDVFLSHNSNDKPVVRELGQALRQRAIRVWLDEWELVPGRPWQASLQEIIQTTRSAAVLVGKDGIGPWQSPEIDACLIQFVDRSLPVIPVLLPGAGTKPQLPPFLSSLMWVDMRAGITPSQLDRLEMGITGDKPQVDTGVPVEPRVSVSMLPRFDSPLVGRKEELGWLDEAWNDPQAHIVSLVSFGGMGKSALMSHWLQQMENDHWRGARIVFGHSFANQGNADPGRDSADSFLLRALEFFGDSDSNNGSSWDKGERLARLVRRQSTLLVLDGIESLQYPRSSGRGGEIMDPGLLALLRELADNNNGLCLVTTREQMQGLGSRTASVRSIALDELSPEEGAALLKQIGVKGTTEQLQAASQEVNGHGLALSLLGKYLVKAHGGDVKRRDVVDFAKADRRQGGPANELMLEYERWFGDGPELCIMRLLGLFDRPANSGELTALRSSSIPDLTDAFSLMSDGDWEWAVSNLRECGLIMPGDSAEDIDAHPMVRDHFANRLKEQHSDACRRGHRCLYEYLKESTPRFPGTLPEMMPLYHAVTHGCLAGAAKSVAVEVYVPRIIRGNENRPFSVYELGGVSTDLNAIANFFDRLWDQPNPGLEEYCGAVCLMASLDLRASARLEEAEQSSRRALDITIETKNWKYAGTAAIGLGDLMVAKGKLGSAIAVLERAVDLVDRNPDPSFWQSRARSSLGHALHLAGFNTQARLAFEDAESLRARQNPDSSLLYGMHGFRYCELLLDEIQTLPRETVDDRSQRCLELQLVRDRIASTSSYDKDNNVSVLDRALEQLTIVKSWLLEHEITASDDSEYLDLTAEHLIGESGGLSLLRQTGRRDYLPAGLLLFAVLARQRFQLTGDSLDLDESDRVRTRAEMIAGDGPLLIWKIEAELERVRFELTRGDHEAAAIHLRQSQSLIDASAERQNDGSWNWTSQRPRYVDAVPAEEVIKYARCNAAVASLRAILDLGPTERASSQSPRGNP